VEILEQKHGAVRVLKPVGPLCGQDAERFKNRADEIVAESMGRLVVDGSAMPYADSRGLELLLDLSDGLAERGQALKLCALQETVREALELTDLASVFEHFEDVNSAVRSFL